MELPDLSDYEPEDLQALANAIQLRRVELQREADQNAALLRDAAAVDAEIAAVMAHAAKVEQIVSMPAGQDLPTVEVGVHWLAEALYQVGALSIRAARLAAGRTQTAETLPGA